jgi:hypothetical protein
MPIILFFLLGTSLPSSNTVFTSTPSFAFAGALSAWDVRFVVTMSRVFDSIHDPSASFCGFYWMTSGTAMLEFKIDGDIEQQYSCAAEGDTCQVVDVTLPSTSLIPDINIDAENPGTICNCPPVSGVGWASCKSQSEENLARCKTCELGPFHL